MQPIKISKLLVPAALLAASISMTTSAATANYSVGFTTVPDITIVQIRAMNFGTGLSLANGVACAMEIEDQANAATKYPGDTIMKLASVGPSLVAANAGDLSGAGCLASVGSKGTIGIYEIQGIAGGTVNVTVNNIVGATNFNYVAGGCIGIYDGAGDGDLCTTVVGGTPIAAKLAAAADTVGNTAGSGIPAPGATRIALAGTITTASTHTAGQVLTEQFVIDVTY